MPKFDEVKVLSDFATIFGKDLVIATSSAGLDAVEIVSGRNLGDWVWCLHCERAYRVGWYRKQRVSKFALKLFPEEEFLQMCPYPGCDGDTVVDAWPWKGIREGHPDYPEIPVLGKEYSMY